MGARPAVGGTEAKNLNEEHSTSYLSHTDSFIGDDVLRYLSVVQLVSPFFFLFFFPGIKIERKEKKTKVFLLSWS